MNNVTKNLILWITISLVMVVLFNMFNQPPATETKLAYSEFIQSVERGQVASVKIQGDQVSGVMIDGRRFGTFAPRDQGLVDKLLANKVQVVAEPAESVPWYMSLLLNWFPMLLIIGVWIFFMRQMQGGGGGKGGAMSFGRSRAKMMTAEETKVTFADVAGVDEAKEELSEIVEFLSNPKKFTRLGGRIPKGVLLVGPPGTGKTLMARAVAGEAGVPFFSISGSDFVEMFVGVGAARVRDLFTQGKKSAPCLIFIDEIDAVGRQRGAGLGGGHDEREQTLNQMLVEMDGFESNEGVILIAATNRPDVLDPALLRPGRFDRQVVVPTPDLRGRTRILQVHTRKTPLDPSVNLEVIARGTPGFSGADLENLVNEAALHAAKLNKNEVDMLDFEEAKDKVLMGKERRSLILSEEEKRVTAYHEAGHALAAKLLPGTDPVHKVTIIPRGMALGVTQQLPVDDRHGYSKQYLMNQLVVLLGGRAAEELFLGEITTGATNDIERASKIARRMVRNFGMSDKLGPLAFGDSSEQVFLGKELIHNRDYSEDTARLIDAEVRRFVDEAHEKTRTLLGENAEVMHRIAAALLERETITGADIDLLMEGKELPPMPKNGGSGTGPQSGGGAEGPAAPEKEASSKEPSSFKDHLDATEAKDEDAAPSEPKPRRSAGTLGSALAHDKEPGESSAGESGQESEGTQPSGGGTKDADKDEFTWSDKDDDKKVH
ncbi:peptidase M41 FtsH domain protein [Alkalidesulfovibrio alkalitolerans DSM 16529]|uniref:ATP-dependent zinc metalloprotease FtsH n=1 Tax=Alkalidesulfovibrio alkalitolerans DSM 16529 TaxID=1121439 RepID=S7UR80_9BACT|nr:ATP-dependent zinc metalloprotease FtsH [Alkalidesulfovibrio alkalitolerans]EPR34783.1 peptidase M41 FtsH domain protein [Alkalidesulfovibrio alkalitolerans DSM 16529]